MIDTLTNLFDGAGLMPHGVCFAWRPDLVFAHAGADLLITLAYLIIPVALYKLVRSRTDIQFGWVLYTFAAFILLCGVTHAVNIYVLWEPNYAFQALIKLATAMVSIATAFLVWQIMPALEKLPSLTKALNANALLETEVANHTAARKELARRTLDLEGANAELEDINVQLETEIEDRKVIQRQLSDRSTELQTVNADLIESNQSLASEVEERKAIQTRLAELTQELQRSNEDLESFAYTASHDLRAPLRGIGNLIGWLREDLGENVDEDADEKFRLMTDRVQRMERMLEDLLQYSRIGRSEMSTTDFRPEEKIQEAFDLLNAEQRFTLEISDDLPELHGTPIAFQQVVANVIGNAIKHHDGETGTIKVSASRLDGFDRITISDDGPGIPEQYRERVFALFQTLKSRDSVEGSGMGLAIVRRVLDVAGGRASISDTNEGRGAAVHIEWPRNKEQADAA